MWDKLKDKALELNEQYNTKENRDKAFKSLNKGLQGTANVTRKGMKAFGDGVSKSSNVTIDKMNDMMTGNKNIKCIRCKSTNVEFISNDRKGFSVGKATAGGLLAGDVGTLAGFAGKKGKKNIWYCKDCGKQFKK